MIGWVRRVLRLRPPDGDPTVYRAYTTEFDKVVWAKDFIAEQIEPKGRSAKAKAALWDVLTSPCEARRRADERARAFRAKWAGGHDLGARPLVTLLIDHSGSMRGVLAHSAAITAHVLAEAFDAAGIDYEVLGFTTASWRGGQSRLKWLRQGSPRHPGRLCDLRHVLYRDAGAPDPQWDRELVALLMTDVLKENIDGEALLWAQRRARAFGPSTWVCMVISDGAPVDDSTLSENKPSNKNGYLVDHLLSVIAAFQKEPGIRLGGFGLRYEVNRYYPVSRAAVDLDDAPAMAIDLLDGMIWPPAATEGPPPDGDAEQVAT
jgi:cobalamin biosynthesis protein CobT